MSLRRSILQTEAERGRQQNPWSNFESAFVLLFADSMLLLTILNLSPTLWYVEMLSLIIRKLILIVGE